MRTLTKKKFRSKIYKTTFTVSDDALAEGSGCTGNANYLPPSFQTGDASCLSPSFHPNT